MVLGHAMFAAVERGPAGVGVREGVVGIVFRDGLASIRVVFGIDDVHCKIRMTSEDD